MDDLSVRTQKKNEVERKEEPWEDEKGITAELGLALGRKKVMLS